MDVLINSMGGGIFLPCMCIPNHHVVHFKYLTIVFANFMSIKQEKKRNGGFAKANARLPCSLITYQNKFLDGRGHAE